MITSSHVSHTYYYISLAFPMSHLWYAQLLHFPYCKMMVRRPGNEANSIRICLPFDELISLALFPGFYGNEDKIE